MKKILLEKFKETIPSSPSSDHIIVHYTLASTPKILLKESFAAVTGHLCADPTAGFWGVIWHFAVRHQQPLPKYNFFLSALIILFLLSFFLQSVWLVLAHDLPLIHRSQGGFPQLFWFIILVRHTVITPQLLNIILYLLTKHLHQGFSKPWNACVLESI
jgi:hypothetical protein